MNYPVDDRRPWLARARAQSAQLAASRGRVVPPFRGATPCGPTRSPVRVARLATLVVLAMMALASGAWALVSRLATPKQARLDAVASDPPRATRRIAPPATIPVARPVVVATKRPPPLARTATVATPLGPVKFGEGDADFILVPPRPVQPPLFDPREYKERGLAP